MKTNAEKIQEWRDTREVWRQVTRTLDELERRLNPDKSDVYENLFDNIFRQTKTK